MEELRRRGIRVVCLNGAGKFDPRPVSLVETHAGGAAGRDSVVSVLGQSRGPPVGASVQRGPCGVLHRDEIVSEGWLVRMIDRFTFHWSHAVVCCSEAVRRSVSNCLGAPAPRQTIIPFGVDAGQLAVGDAASRKELRLRDGGPIVGTVPARRTEKGLRAVAGDGDVEPARQRSALPAPHCGRRAGAASRSRR